MGVCVYGSMCVWEYVYECVCVWEYVGGVCVCVFVGYGKGDK